jgi:uncharacterized membrane protein
MKFHQTNLFAVIVVSGLAMALVSPAQALSMKDCSAKYKAAQAAGTLNGMKWNEFRKAQCGADAAPAAAETPAAAATTEAAKTAAPPPSAPESVKAAAPAADAGNAGSAVFPAAVSDKYATEKPGKARMKTCLDQYNANKATNANGGLKWIQKGGGYFSECSKRLKGS